jgi:hypothetical protein
MTEVSLPGFMDKAYPITDARPNDERLASLEHIKELARHFNKYDSSWGSDFRIPIEDEPVHKDGGIGGLRSDFIHRNRNSMTNKFKNYVAEKAQKAQNKTLANNVNIPTGL